MIRRGLAQLRIHEVASEAGLSQGALYRHFGGKEDLLLAVILDSVPRVAAFVDTPLTPDTGAEDALRSMIFEVLGHERRMASIALTVLADEALHQRFQAAVAQAGGGPQHFLGLISRRLAQHQQAGHLRDNLNVTEAAATIQARCFHHAVLKRLHGDYLAPETPEQLAAALLAQLLPVSAAPPRAANTGVNTAHSWNN